MRKTGARNCKLGSRWTGGRDCWGGGRVQQERVGRVPTEAGFGAQRRKKRVTGLRVGASCRVRPTACLARSSLAARQTSQQSTGRHARLVHRDGTLGGGGVGWTVDRFGRSVCRTLSRGLDKVLRQLNGVQVGWMRACLFA